MNAGTALAGVVGWPIDHSLSPMLHKYWLEQSQIRGMYLPIALRKEDFAAGLHALRRSGFVGVNVTVPYKEAALAISHKLDGAAILCGAANLLIFRENGRIEGRNTDVSGLVASLKEEFGNDVVRGKHAVVYGAGGAARAAIVALDKLGAGEISVLNRTASRAQHLVQQMQSRVQAMLSAVSPQDTHKAMERAALLANATSAGMNGISPPNLPLDSLPSAAAVCDLIYNPLETELLKAARARGHRIMNGLGMLLFQAAPAFEAFFGVRPAVTPALREKLAKALAP